MSTGTQIVKNTAGKTPPGAPQSIATRLSSMASHRQPKVEVMKSATDSLSLFLMAVSIFKKINGVVFISVVGRSR